MATATERLLVRIDATTESLRRELRMADKALGRHQKTTESTLKRIDKAYSGLRKSIVGLQGAVAAIGFGKAVKEIVSAADSMAQMRGQLKLVTGSQEELNHAYEESLKISNALGQSTETTVNLYARLARSTASLALSQDELLGITQTISQAMLVSGASAEESSRAITQLSQALAGGVLRAEEFNSITEQAPYLLDQMAESLGVTRGELRQMVVDGEVTTEMMVKSFQDMADRVETDVGKIPMTIGRTMQALANEVNNSLGQIDTSELQGSIEELGKVLSDPGVQQGLKNIAEGLITLTGWIGKAAAAYANLGQAAGEFFAKLAGYQTIQDEIAEKEAQLAMLEKQRVRGGTAARERQRKRVEELRAEIEKLREQYKEFLPQQEESAKNTEAEAASALKLVKVTAKRVEFSEKITKQIKKDAAALKKYIDDLQFEVDIMRESAKEQAVLTAVRRAGVSVDSEAAQKIRDLIEARWEHNEAMERAAEATKKVADEAQRAADKMGPFQKALQDTAARIDSAFASAFKGAFDSFEDFADGMKDAMQNLLAELAYLILRQKLVIPIAASFGMGSAAGSAASVAGSAGSSFGLPGAGSIASMFSSNAFFNNALVGIENTGIALSGGMLTGGGAQALGGLATGGAGLVGGYFANQLFGGGMGTSIGSGLGGLGGGLAAASLLPALGAFGGPLGALGGALLGGAVGSLFGGENNGNNAGVARLNFGTGEFSVAGSGKTFDPANVQAAQELADFVVQLADAVGGSDAAFKLKVGTRGINIDGQKFGKDQAAAIAFILDKLIQT